MSPELKATLLSLFVQYVVPPLFAIVMAGAAWALWKLSQFLNSKAGESKLAAVAARISHLAEGVVADLEATLKPELVEATKDGVLTKAEITRLREVALARLKQLAGERGLAELQLVLGLVPTQVDSYLTGVIEKAVDRLPPSQALVEGVVTKRSP